MLGYRVLIVEDDAAASLAVRSIIEGAGYEVVGTASSGEEALTIAEELNPDVAIMDIRLPGMDGIETTRQLVERHNLAVMIVTAYADPEFVQGAARAGACSYLLKPVTKEALCANLEIAAARSNELMLLRQEAEDMKGALEVRKLSERAKHVLMSRLALSEVEAFAHIKQKCRNQNKTLKQVSIEILTAEEAFLQQIAKEPPKKLKNDQ